VIAKSRNAGTVCTFACRKDYDLHNLPFQVAPDDLLAALVSTTAERQPA
jgi:glycerol dehydrogenase-like iron-containing ADH family enzyme